MMSTIPGVVVGAILAGKYRVDRILGAGGMGLVVAAHHLQLDEPVAIKFLLPDLVANDEAIARFTREARAAVKIKSEHVARVLDVGQLETGAPFMVMEFLDGSDLSSWLHGHGRLRSEQAVEFLLQACEALAEAHNLGIVHRDLKPSNLFVIRTSDSRLSVKVLDFGISKVASAYGTRGDAAMTRTGTVLGTPLYMSPEQMQSSASVDARADVWALGVILYELLAGRPPFTGDSIPEVCAAILTTTPQPLRVYRPDVPAPLEAAVRRCLARDRAERFADVGELADALAAFGTSEARASVDRISRVLGAPKARSGSLASVTATAPSSSRGPARGTVVAAATHEGHRASGRTSMAGAMTATLGAGDTAHEDLRRSGRRTFRTLVAVASLVLTAGAGAAFFALRHAPASADAAASRPPEDRPSAIPPATASGRALAAVPTAAESALPAGTGVHGPDGPGGQADAPAAASRRDSTSAAPAAHAAHGPESTKHPPMTVSEPTRLPASISRSPATSQPSASPPASSARPASAPAPAGSCTPPYTIDPATGEKRWKLDCLQ